MEFEKLREIIQAFLRIFIGLDAPVLTCDMRDLSAAVCEFLACGIESPDHGPPALGAQSLTHWMGREVLTWAFIGYIFINV